MYGLLDGSVRYYFRIVAECALCICCRCLFVVRISLLLYGVAIPAFLFVKILYFANFVLEVFSI